MAEAAGGYAALAQLVEVLDLEPIEVDIFRGVSPQTALQRVFGGQVAGQALVAAGRTVPPDRAVHSLHAYFLRPGDPALPIVYTVDRIRDGRSFTSRRVVAVQHGQAIFSLSASFQAAESGFEHQDPMPDVPDAESLPTFEERIAPYAERIGAFATLPRPIELRYIDDPPWVQRDAGPRDARSRVWMRSAGPLPDDPLLHACALTFASDLTLLDSVQVRHGVAFGADRVLPASLDHAMWFHRPFRFDEWLLYTSESPSATGGRGLAIGRFWSRAGDHVVTVVQEGLLRIARS
ncbi:MAG: acyl-CoA thioesterase II [Pseudonocardiales bacterium]|nr:MAG: acyl-CoA thioesterase II [Pseudonocardiales bacterium]